MKILISILFFASLKAAHAIDYSGLTEVMVDENKLLSVGKIENESDNGIIVAECTQYGGKDLYECVKARIVYQLSYGQSQAFLLVKELRYAELLGPSKDAAQLFKFQYRPFPIARRASQLPSAPEGSTDVLIVKSLAMAGGALIDTLFFIPRLPVVSIQKSKEFKRKEQFEKALSHLISVNGLKSYDPVLSKDRFENLFQKLKALNATAL